MVPVKRIDVLLAMGSPALLAVTEEALLREGLSVKSVSNGLDTVTMAFSMKPRLVLCGQVLAGMDGIKVCRFLNTVYSRKEVPVIISFPDSSPDMRRKATSASAISTIDYSTSSEEIVKLIRLNMSNLRASEIQDGPPVSRDRIMLMAADCIEDSLESIETVVSLASELSGVTSVSEACRKVVVSILGGLGLQRVWIGMLNSVGTAVDAVAYRGRGITGEPIRLSGTPGYLPVDMVFTSGIQVVSWNLEFQETRETWLGSVAYVDTPIKAGSRVLGIIRCDNGISKKRPSDNSLHVLNMLAGELSYFIKYFNTQSRLDGLRSMFEMVLNSLDSRAVAFTDSGMVHEVYGHRDTIACFKNAAAGMPLAEVLDTISENAAEKLEHAVSEKRNAELKTVSVTDGKQVLGLSLQQRDPEGMLLLASDRTIRGNLEKTIRLLEFETDAIASLAADLTSQVDVREICRTMLRTLETFYPDEAIAVLAAGEVSSSVIPEKLIVHAVSGAGDATVLQGATIHIRETSEAGIVSESVRTGRTINIPDVLQSDFLIRALPDVRSELAMPMLSRGRVVGVIDLKSNKANRFLKDDIRRLNNIVGFAAGVLETALQQTELIKMARHDRLTGLHNMTFFEERYPEEFERAERYEYSFSLIMMDIDDFKHYNDSFGHPMGNILLQKLTGAMKDALRDVDLLVRYGGEEFVCILPLTDKQVASDIAERIRVKVIEASRDIPNAAGQPRGFVSLSLGVATFPVDSREMNELIEIADQRMYRAKGNGKNRVCFN